MVIIIGHSLFCALGVRWARPPQCLLDESGNPTSAEVEIKQVWQKHVAQGYQGRVVQKSDLRQQQGPWREFESQVQTGPEATSGIRFTWTQQGRWL